MNALKYESGSYCIMLLQPFCIKAICIDYINRIKGRGRKQFSEVTLLKVPRNIFTHIQTVISVSRNYIIL